MGVDVGDEGVDLLVHDDEVVPLPLVVRLLEDGLQEEGVLGQPLHRPHQDVEEAESVAILLRLAPLQRKKKILKKRLANRENGGGRDFDNSRRGRP